jgi:hypothetical protein
MMAQVYLLSKAGTRRVQPPPPLHPKVTMTVEACMALRTEQHQKTEQFHNNLSTAWKSVDERMHTLTADHHKSVRHVQTDLHFRHIKFSSRRKPNPWNAFLWQQGRECHKLKVNGLVDHGNFLSLVYYIDKTGFTTAPSGKAVLPSMVKENIPEYQALHAADKTQLIKDLSEFHATKAVGTHISAQSKLNDMTHTVKVVETEICYLPNLFCAC